MKVIACVVVERCFPGHIIWPGISACVAAHLKQTLKCGCWFVVYRGYDGPFFCVQIIIKQDFDRKAGYKNGRLL